MPQAPIIIPIIIAGITLGSLLVSEKRTLSKKKFLLVCLLSGCLNVANGFLVYQFAPPPTFTRGGGGGFSGGTSGFQFRAASTTSESGYLISSFLVGLLVVLAVVGIALLYAHFKRTKVEEEEEADLEDRSERRSRFRRRNKDEERLAET